MLGSSFVALLAVVASTVNAQLPPTPSSWPHDYPGKPLGDFSPEWQSYFEVTDALPDVTWTLPRNFAGNLPVNRPNHPNNTLFFWAFETENGSLTATAGDRSNQPWGIWLNGGPGSSSLLGFQFENGPIHLDPFGNVFENQFSWDRVVDYIWIDQPVGVGWATTDSDGFVHDEDEMGRDFMGFLENLVKVFPSLATRPLYLTGESYAGTYIPYIMKTYFGLANPPVNIAKFAIGDGTLGNTVEFEYLPTVTTIQTYPQLIGYDPAVFEFFREQEHLCGYDLNLTYPQSGHFPTLEFVNPSNPLRADFAEKAALKRGAFHQTLRTFTVEGADLRKRDEFETAIGSGSAVQKRDLSGRANGTLDPWYGCFVYDEMIDYALNFSTPWNVAGTFSGFDVYQVPDALNPEDPLDASGFYNNPQVVTALHAPTSKHWAGSIPYPFLGDLHGNDPSVEPMAFLSELATNMTAHGISVVLYSGNDDSLIAHRSTEVVIQNTTFGGVQGFSRRPSTPWFDDSGARAGIVHQERNWTYVLVEGAGHLVPHNTPARALTLLREFIIGSNGTGLLSIKPNGQVAIEGGEDAALAVDAITGQPGIFVGSITTTSTVFYPAETVASWNSFIASATALSRPTAAVRRAVGVNAAARGLGVGLAGVLAAAAAGALAMW